MLRTKHGISQRQLAEVSGISNTEVSRIESGDRQNPSPAILKSMATYLGTTYEDLMTKAGYLENQVDHGKYIEKVYKDEKGKVVDIHHRIKEMYEKDVDWANLAYRVSNSELSDTELEIIKSQTQNLLDQFLKNKNK